MLEQLQTLWENEDFNVRHQKTEWDFYLGSKQASYTLCYCTVIIWILLEAKMVVNHTKWCPAKSLHGTMVHILRTLIALVEGFPLLNPNTRANLSSTPTKELNKDPFVEFLSTHEYRRRLVQMSVWFHFLIFFCKTEIIFCECLERGEREGNQSMSFREQATCLNNCFLLTW